MIVYGSGMADGNAHAHADIPTLLFGKGGGTIDPGRHVVLPAEHAHLQSLALAHGADGRGGGAIRRQHRPAKRLDGIKPTMLPLSGDCVQPELETSRVRSSSNF